MPVYRASAVNLHAVGVTANVVSKARNLETEAKIKIGRVRTVQTKTVVC
jgi:hypothetical protein